MARKKTEDKEIAEIKSIAKSEKIIIGTEKTLKSLKRGEIEKIFVSSNCPEKVKSDIAHYCKVGKSKMIPLNFSNEELGEICKKPFSISVLGLKNE